MDTANNQLPFLTGRILFRIGLPGNFNKSGFVTDNSHIKMHDFFLKSGSPSKCLSHFVAQKIFNSILSCCFSCKVSSFTSTSWLLSQHLPFQPALLTLPSFSHQSAENFPLSCYFFKILPMLYLAIQSFILPNIKEVHLQMLKFEVRGDYSWQWYGLLYLICMLEIVELLGLKETPVCMDLKPLFFTIRTQVTVLNLLLNFPMR